MVREKEVQAQSWKKNEYYLHTSAAKEFKYAVTSSAKKLRMLLLKEVVRGLDNKEGSRLGCSSLRRLCRTTWRTKRLRKRLQFM